MKLRRVRRRRALRQDETEMQSINNRRLIEDDDHDTTGEIETISPLAEHIYDEVCDTSLYQNQHDANLINIQYQNIFYEVFSL